MTHIFTVNVMYIVNQALETIEKPSYNPGTSLQIITFLNFHQYESKSVIIICTTTGAMQTETAVNSVYLHLYKCRLIRRCKV